MKQTYTREKRTLCGEGYMEVDLYPITPEEHAGQAEEEDETQQREAEKAERPALPPVAGAESQRQLYRAGILSDPDLHRHLFAGEHGAGPAGSAQLHPPGEGCHRKAVRPRRGAAGDGPDRLRAKERALPPPLAGGVQRADHASKTPSFRQLLEDKWAMRWPDGSVESLGTANADRLNLQNRLDDLITYFEKHGQMRWYETRNLHPAGGAHPQRHPMEPQAAAQGLHRLQGQRLLVGAAIPGLEVRAVRRAGAGRAGRRKRGLGRRRAALLCGDGKAGGCESSHLTDKVPVFCVLTRAEERRRGIDQGAETTGAGRAAGSAGRGKATWAGVITLTMDYYEAADPVCGRLLQLRYLDGMPEERVVAKLHIGRTTYYHKELEALSTVGISQRWRG